MKRHILSLLALLLCALLALTSCEIPVPPESSAEQQSESGSEESIPDVSGSDSSAEESEAEVIIEYETIVSVGKSYTVTKEADSKYPDAGHTKLTDGIYADSVSYQDEHYAGFQASASSVRITLEMEEDYGQIYKFGISYLSSTEAGLGPIGACRVFYSLDGEKWTRTNFFTRPTYEEGTQQTAWLSLDRPVNARYVRFDIKGESGWLFLDELIVIANRKGGSAASSGYLTSLAAAYENSRPKASDFVSGNGEADREAYAPYQVTNGARYTASYESSAKYPDSDDLLTDGEATGRALARGVYAGYEGGEPLNIDVFLNDPFDGICDFELAMYQISGLKYNLPYYVDFYISDDGKNYSKVGRVFAPDDPAVTNFSFQLHLDQTYSALWIRYALPKTESKMYLIEEAYAASYMPDPNKQLYPAVSIETCEEPENWPEQNKKETNLALGLSYQIESSEVLYYADEKAHNTQPDAGVLTDGKYSPNTVFDNGYWNRTRRGESRTVYFDFGYASTVTRISSSWLNYPSYAIRVPSYFTVFVSLNGRQWYDIGTVNLESSEESAAKKAELKLKTPVVARYVKITFPVNPHSYCDEIEIYGMKTVTSKAKRPEAISTVSLTDTYLAPQSSILNGVHDVTLIYHNIVNANEDYFLPYVAYLDKEGNIQDTMFDGYLFLPSTRSLPSGGYPYNSSENPNKWSDWEYLYNDLFTEGKNFDALNKTVATVKEALSLPDDYKVQVIPTLLYLNPESKFGDCDGDGKDEDLTTLEGRLKVIGYTMDLYLKTFKEKNYENLELAGFYWFHEAADYEKDGATIKGASDLAHSKGKQLCWIPYYCAQSYNLWSHMGFDCAVMQPNYVFKEEVPYSQLVTAAQLIKNNGMGIEIEISARALGSAIYTERYLAYLGYGIEAGYMSGCIHMYYQEANVFYQACKSSSASDRIIYDATYRFIHGTLSGPETPEDKSFETASGKALTGKVVQDGIAELDVYELVASAKNGSVSIAPNGSFVYIPNDGFTGEDSFSFRYSNAIAWSNEINVTVRVS